MEPSWDSSWEPSWDPSWEPSWDPSWDPFWDPSSAHESESLAYSDLGPPSMESGRSNEHYAFDFSATSGDMPCCGLEYSHGGYGAASDGSAGLVSSFYGSSNHGQLAGRLLHHNHTPLDPASCSQQSQLRGNHSIPQSRPGIPGRVALCVQTQDFPADQPAHSANYSGPLASDLNGDEDEYKDEDEDAYDYEPDTYHDSNSSRTSRISRASNASSVLSPVSMQSQPSNGGSSASSRGDVAITTTTTTTTTASQSSGRTKQHERNREKNRLAASKCREKSKQFIDDLRRHERELARKKQVLKDTANGLQDEVLALKHEVLSHGNCDCEYIQNYLAAAAKQIA